MLLLNCVNQETIKTIIKNIPGREQVKVLYISKSLGRTQHCQETIFKTMRATKKKANTPRRPDVRSIKISEQLRINEWSRTTVPFIRLSGVWLENLGFKPYERVTITTMEKLLIIRLDEEN